MTSIPGSREAALQAWDEGVAPPSGWNRGVFHWDREASAACNGLLAPQVIPTSGQPPISSLVSQRPALRSTALKRERLETGRVPFTTGVWEKSTKFKYLTEIYRPRIQTLRQEFQAQRRRAREARIRRQRDFQRFGVLSGNHAAFGHPLREYCRQ
jgi:hypothetical protein